MAKLILHVIVAASLWLGLRALGVPTWVRLLALVAGATAVHHIWERLFPEFFSPGSIPVADDDPLMLEALNTARETMPRFLRMYPAHRTDSIVKFRLLTDQGVTECVWADLVEITKDGARVYVRTPPVHQSGQFDPSRVVPVADFIDWQIEFRDGTLRGGYTNQAVFRVFEREKGYLPPAMIPHIARFKELRPEDVGEGI